MRNYIGLDWGERKVGAAFGNDQTKIAFAGELIINDKKVYDQIIRFAKENDASVFVLGTSSNHMQNDNREAIQEFADGLSQVSCAEIVFADEMFTTKQAQQNLKEAGKKKITQEDDVEAARILLQGYLDAL